MGPGACRYIAELAPFASRGGLATLVQAATVSGILAAQLTNYATQYIPGWCVGCGSRVMGWWAGARKCIPGGCVGRRLGWLVDCGMQVRRVPRAAARL